jgi:ubiquitin-protein ligase
MFKQIAQNQKNKDNQIKVTSEALLRLKTDLSEIKSSEELLKLADFQFPQPDEYEFTVTIRPKQNSLWYRGVYPFRFIIPAEFPHNKGPSVKCIKRVNYRN